MTGLWWYILEFQFIKLFLEYHSVILGSDIQTYLMETLSARTEALNLIGLGKKTQPNQLIWLRQSRIYCLSYMKFYLSPGYLPCLGLFRQLFRGIRADTGCAQKASSEWILFIKAATSLVSKWCYKPQTSWTTFTTTSFSKYNANFSNDKFSAAISSWYHRLNSVLFFYLLSFS